MSRAADSTVHAQMSPRPAPAGLAALAAELTARLGPSARILDDPSILRQYARDLGEVPGFMADAFFRTTPDMVVQPATAEDIQATLDVARQHGVPIVPRGVASWGFGGAVPTRGGIVIDASPLDGIGEVDPATRTVVVEGGAKWGHIERRLEPWNLALMCFPSSRFSTVAGWISTGGYGLTAFGRGHLRNAVEWIECVAPNGQLLHVDRDHECFDLLFGSEGQLGVIVRVALRLLPRAQASYPHLVYGDRQQLFRFVETLAATTIDAPMVKYFDASLMQRFNQLYQEHAHEPGGVIVDEQDAILVQVDGSESETAFRRLVDEQPGLRQAPAYVSRYLWHDRFNPLKIQSLGPSLLAGELVIRARDAGPYIDAVKDIGRKFKLELLIESHFLREDGGEIELLLIPMFHSDRRNAYLYSSHVTLVPMLTHLGVEMGGRPYGIGIWNTPFLRDRYSDQHLKRLSRWKSELDSDWIANPGKFWKIRSRLFGLPGLLFTRSIFRFGMRLMLKTAAVRGFFVPRRREWHAPLGSQDHFLMDTALKCTNCGNCVAVCPAYQVTKDERTTARFKLRLGERLVDGRHITQSEADETWICTRCGECERVCQTELPLLAAYDRIEEELTPEFGRPDHKITAFVEDLGQNPDYLELIQSEPFRSA